MASHKNTFIGIVLIILFWQIIALTNLLNPIYFASPHEVFVEAIYMFSNIGIYMDVWNTLIRILISVVISALIGVPIGLLLGYFSKLYAYFDGISDFFRSIPPIVIYPLLLITLGPGDISRIGVAVFGAIIVLILIISRGLLQRPSLRKKYFVTLGASKFQILKHIIRYEALPHIMLALRTITSLVIIIIIVTEMLVGSKYGLGVRVQNVQITSNIPDLFSTIIVIGIMGFLLNKFLVWLDKKYVFWKID